MKAIIALMSDIEKEACEIVDNATEKKVKMYEEFHSKVKKIDEKYSIKLKEELEKVNNKCKHTYEKEVHTVQIDTDSNIEELEKKFNTNHKKYIDDLFNRVIGM